MLKVMTLVCAYAFIHIVSYSQDISTCFEKGFDKWKLNSRINQADFPANSNVEIKNDQIIDRYKKREGLVEIETNKANSFSCLPYRINRLLVSANKDSTVKSVMLTFSFTNSLYELILDSYKQKNVKIVKWGLNPFSDNLISDFTVFLDNYLVAVQIEKDNNQNDVLIVLIKSKAN